MSPKPSSKDIYDMVRSQTEHEDHLIDQRVTWLLVGQGFLFVAYTTLLVADHTVGKVRSAIIVIALVAIFLNVFSIFGIVAAFFHMEKLRRFWGDHIASDLKNVFPPIMGTGKIIKGGYGSIGIPIMLIIAWLFILING
jgi:hypothetical protein